MALKFAEWFYVMLNEDEPIGFEHFWEDCQLNLNLISNEVVQNEKTHAEECTKLLYRTKCKHNLYFNPNLAKDGTQGRMDPHGLVIVLACGTLHKDKECVGVFEQVFSLARDPFSENNWKIKKSELNLRSSNQISREPVLSESDLTSHLLALPSS